MKRLVRTSGNSLRLQRGHPQLPKRLRLLRVVGTAAVRSRHFSTLLLSDAPGVTRSYTSRGRYSC